MGFCGFLTIVLLILKVVGLLNISWFIVFLPVIISTLLVILFIVFRILAEIL